MAFKIHSLSIFLALCLLSFPHTDAFNAARWLKNEQQLRGFSWQNCGPSSDLIQIKSIDASPDPIKVPGNITVGVSLAFTSASPTDIGVAVTMEKKVDGFWVKVPCIDNVGSCNYGDLCKDWAEVCPKYFQKYGIPCTCPIAANSYTIPDTVIDITGKLPPGATGEFRITGNFVSPTAGHIGCLQLNADLAS